jgi:hypothetical protein
MSDWANHVVIKLPQNGTNQHIGDPSNATGGGTVVDGSAFTPTAGRLIVMLAYGGQTAGGNTSVPTSPPSGWTGPANNQAVGNGGLYVWYKTAAGGDTASLLHNGTNYPEILDVYEFGAGSTFIVSATLTGQNPSGGAGPSISGLTGTNWIAGVVGGNLGQVTRTTVVSTWSAGTKIADAFMNAAAFVDGCTYSLSEFNSDTSTSKALSATTVPNTGTIATTERLVFAIKVVAVVAPKTNGFFNFL